MLYYWHGKERSLGTPTLVAQSLSVETFDKVKDAINATGDILMMDYVENVDMRCKWEAEGQHNLGEPVNWSVQYNPEGKFSWQDNRGQPVFTISKTLNNAIETFVKAKLDLYLYSPKDKDGRVADDIPQFYKGPRVVYTGPCTCEQLLNANITTPFPWEAMTKGGQFPQRCFTCSCGRNWWLSNPEKKRWVPIPDTQLWIMLIFYNGEPQKQLGALEDGFYLLQTLRQRGYIPLL